MIRLNATTRKLQVVLAGAITTSQLPVMSSYSDAASSAYTGGATVTNTNSTTAVDIVAAPAASTVRDVDTITVQNADTVAATVTVRYNDNGTTYTLFKALLAVGDQIVYTHGGGWKVLDSSGNTKDVTAPAPAGTLTGTTLASNVVASSLTSVGTLTSLTVSGTMALGASGMTVTGTSAAWGFGVTPSAWNLGKALEVNSVGNGLWSDSATSMSMTNNVYYNAGYKFAGTGYASLFNMSGGAHYWYTSSASGTAGNTATMNTLMTLSTGGVLDLPYGQIKFPATQNASSNANTLDDYEEGTWTPTFSRDGSPPTISYSTQNGTYVKIGRHVFLQAALVIATVSAAGTGSSMLTGVPFPNNDGSYTGNGAIGYNDAFVNTVYASVTTGSNTFFRSGTRSSANDTGGFSSGGYLELSFNYLNG